jgi:putative ABC transport system permease protein
MAFANLAQYRVRLSVALLGTAVALLLLLLQVSFLTAIRTQATAVYDLLDFDIALVPGTYQTLIYTGAIDRVRLSQAGSVEGVSASAALNIGSAGWTALPSRRRSSVLVLGIDDADAFVKDTALRRGLATLDDNRSVVMDDYSSPGFGALATGDVGEISGRRVVITGHFKLGLFFYADGSVFVRNSAFSSLTRRPSREFGVGLIRLLKGADPREVKARLIKALPNDVQVYLRQELVEQERDYFTVTKPIGIMLKTGMIIAFLVGAVVLYQVLSTEISRRLKEYAVLKAMGFSPIFVYGIGMVQVAVISAGGLILAAGFAEPVLWIVSAATHLPTGLSLWLFLVGAGAAGALCIASAAIVLRRVTHADPAALF